MPKSASFDKVAAHRARERDVQYGAPQDPARRKRLEASPIKWLKWYGHGAFPLAWASFHKVCIRKLHVAFTQGGNFAVALPRGSGKTTIVKWMALWAIFTGTKHYGLLVGATDKKSKQILMGIKKILRFNDRLMADYPEICAPIRELANVAMRAKAQTAFGEPTSIDWTAGRLVLPTSHRIGKDRPEDNPASGAIIESCGITGDIRGSQEEKEDGTVLRPDFAICDDPQTKESAKSIEQTKHRLDIINQDVAMSEGTTTPLSLVIPCTVIRQGDLSSQVLDNDLYPDFRGECHPLLESMPDDMDLWTEYNLIRKKGLKAEDDGRSARKFYKENRKALDKGCVCTWPSRKLGTVSGIQYAMDKYFKLGEHAFWAECQNKPLSEDSTIYDIDVKIVMSRVNGFKRWVCPGDVSHVVVCADINRAGLHWTAMGLRHPTTGFIINYGKWPKRGDLWEKNANEIDRKRAVMAGLKGLFDHLGGVTIIKNGQRIGINLALIDRGFDPDTVHQFLQVYKAGFDIQAAWGFAHHKYNPEHKTAVRRSAKDGIHTAEVRQRQFLAFDACKWREFTQRGFLGEPGTPGSVSIYGNEPLRHDMFAAQFCNERLTDIALGANNDQVYRWITLPGPHDWLDSTVGCLVAGAQLGYTMSGDDEGGIVIRRRARKARPR